MGRTKASCAVSVMGQLSLIQMLNVKINEGLGKHETEDRLKNKQLKTHENSTDIKNAADKSQ